MKRSERPERAGDILDTFFRRHNISGGKDHVSFYRSWEQIVGFDIASHTSVTDIRYSALLVEVDHPAWMQMVQLRRKQILATVQNRFPRLGVKSLNLRLVERLAAPIAAPPVAGPDAPQTKSAGKGTAPGTVASSTGGAAPRADGGDSGAGDSAGKPRAGTDEPDSARASTDRLQGALKRLGRAICEREDE